MSYRVQTLPTVIRNPIPIAVEDEILHTPDHPFCGDWRCPCHFDEDMIWQYYIAPLRAGLLTRDEAGRFFYGRRL